MGKRNWKAVALTIGAGGIVFHTACLNIGGFGKLGGQFAFDLAEYAAFEFVLDNDSVFDLFQDDFGTGTQYDDRFTADATRVEPDDDAQAAVDVVAPGRP
ncbi:MAG: hypothetical protein GY778_00745 [bacterium]|nr:hypothetical protein [bacterium]